MRERSFDKLIFIIPLLCAPFPFYVDFQNWSFIFCSFQILFIFLRRDGWKGTCFMVLSFFYVTHWLVKSTKFVFFRPWNQVTSRLNYFGLGFSISQRIRHFDWLDWVYRVRGYGGRRVVLYFQLQLLNFMELSLFTLN